MKNPSSISTRILDELLTTIEIVGVDKTIKSLQDAKLHSLTLNNVDIEFILNVVCEVTNVRKDRLLYGNERSDDKKIAIGLSVYFLKSVLLYSYSEIKKIFNKDESALYRYYVIVEDRPKKSKTEFDKNLEASFKKVNLILTEKKLKNGTTI